MAEPRPPALRDLLVEKGRALFSGRIDVQIGALAGVIHFSEGQVVDARIGPLVGEPALWRMLLTDAQRVGAEPGRARTTGGAVLGLPGPLIERFDERAALLERYAEKVGGFDALWALRFDVLGRRLDELPDAINPLLRLLDGRRTVRQVVAESPLEEMLSLRILGRLLASGVLEMPASVVVTRPPEHASFDDEDGGLAQALRHTADEAARDPILLETPKPSSPRAPTAPSARPDPPAPATAPQRQDELRAWLGSEEAFFQEPPRAAPSTPPGPAPLVVPPAMLVVLVCTAAILGALFMSRCG